MRENRDCPCVGVMRDGFVGSRIRAGWVVVETEIRRVHVIKLVGKMSRLQTQAERHAASQLAGEHFTCGKVLPHHRLESDGEKGERTGLRGRTGSEHF